MSENFHIARVGGAGGVADLVFIHGLTGDMVTTWTSPGSDDPAGDYWPKWICEEVPNLNVYTLNYPTSLFGKWSQKEMTLYDRGKATLDYLASYRFGKRPIGFVTHSLGGLLAKQIVRTGFEASDEAWRSIANSCRLVIFLATPHTGASLASVFTFAFPRISSTHIQLLRSDSSELDQLNAAYRRLASELKIKTAPFYETHKTKNLGILIDRVSADPGVAGAELVAVGADHIGICKPPDRAPPPYTSIRRHVFDFVEDAAKRQKQARPPSHIPVQSHELAAFVYDKEVANEIYVVLPFDGETIFSAPIRFVIETSSPKSVKNVYLHLELADSLYLHQLTRSVDKIGAGREINVFTDKGRNEHIARVLYKLPSIGPQVRFVLWDRIFAKDPTLIPIDTPVTLKGGEQMVVSSKILTALPVALTLDGEDALPWSGEIKIHFRNGNIEEFTAVKRAENRLIKELMRSGVQKVRPTEATFIGFKKFSKHPVEGGGLKILDADPDSIMGVNVRITPRGLEPHGKVGPL